MTPPKVGQLIQNPAEARDAIHVPVLPAVAAQTLYPGYRCSLRSTDGWAYHDENSSLGVVDPFLREPVRAGERFWLFVQPGQVASLRHHWTLSGVPNLDPPGDAESAEKSAARANLQQIAYELDVRLEDLLQHAEAWLHSGKYWNEGEKFEGHYIPDHFWPNFEVLRDKPVPQENQRSFLRCSC